MRLLKPAVTLVAFAVLLFNSGTAEAATDRSISGRLLFENFHFACDGHCVVTLLASGVRPVQTVLPDIAGNFTFYNVPSGSYSIRVEIDGIEAVNQTIDTFIDGPRINVMVPSLPRKQVSSNGTGVVDLSEFLEQYPKNAVSRYQKGSELLKAKKPSEALKYLRSAVELAPNFYQARNQLGLAYR